MSIRFRRPQSKAARWSRWLARFSLLTLVVSWLAVRFGPLPVPAFLLLLGLAGAAAVLAVPLALHGLWRLWQVGAKGGLAATSALITVALPLALMGFAADRYGRLPALYEIATDTADPPAWITPPLSPQGWLPRPASAIAATAAAQFAAYPDVTERRYDGALDRVYQAVRKVAADQRLTITATRGAAYARSDVQPATAADAERQDALPDRAPVPLPRPTPQPEDLTEEDEPLGMIRLQAVTREPLTGFPFDILIRLREEEETVQLDIRVASRYGPHDLGISATLAQRFLNALDGELLGIAAK